MTSYISNFSMQKEMSKNFKKGITFVLPSTYFFVKKNMFYNLKVRLLKLILFTQFQNVYIVKIR